MAIATAEQVRLMLPSLTGSLMDTDLDTLIARFDSLAAQFCGYPDSPGGTVGAARTIERTTYTFYLDGPTTTDPRILDLGVYPVSSVQSVYSDPLREYGSDTLVSSDDYTLIGDQGLLELSSTAADMWDTHYRAIKVSLTLGFDPVPRSIIQACALQVAHWWRGRGSIGQTSASQRGSSIQFSPNGLGLLPAVQALLSDFVLVGGSVG